MQRVCGSAIRASLRQAASSAPLVASRTAVALPVLCQAATRSCRTSSSAVSARTEGAPSALPTETSRVSITPRVLTASTARTTLVSQDVVVQAKRGFRSATLGGSGSGSKFWPLLGAAAGVGLMGLVGYGAFTPSAERSAWQNQDQFTSSQRMNLAKIYGYTAAGLSVTAAAAAAMFSRGLHYRLMGMSPIALMLGGIALTVGTSMLTRMIPYENKVAKHVAWGAFNASVALALCPLGVVGGPLLLKAAATTGCVVGALTLTAAAAPSDTFLNMGGGLSVGLGCLIAASVGQMFFPASGLLYNAVLYGGTGLFGLLLLHDTQRAVAVARYVPPHRLDPINESIGIYMTIVNLFSRIATIMSNRRKQAYIVSR